MTGQNNDYVRSLEIINRIKRTDEPLNTWDQDNDGVTFKY